MTTNHNQQICIYEQPLNERMRLFMRLESIFAQMRNFHRADEYYSIQLFLDALFDVLDFLHRYEIRAEIIKELQRYQVALGKEASPYLSGDELKQTTDDIQLSLTEILDINLNPISALRENELFNSLRQRNFNQSGNCLFEVPAYQFWLSKNKNRSIPFLEDCNHLFSPIARAINLILHLVRSHSQTLDKHTEDGMFIKTLDSSKRHQMLRVHLPQSYEVFPRISGDHHRFSVRFMAQNSPEQRAQQVKQAVSFGLQICTL